MTKPHNPAPGGCDVDQRTIRCAPLWAWAVIDRLLDVHIHHPYLMGTSNDVLAAHKAMCAGCDKEES